MSQGVVKVFTPSGKFVGQFDNPTIDMYPDHYYEVTGQFADERGQVAAQIEFNPEVLPYTLDISGFKQCNHATLQGGYVQRGRQPVKMTAQCKTD